MAARVLIIDDSNTILNLLSMVLRRQGYEVVTACNGFEGLAQLENQAVDLVISDVNMPRMNGITFLCQVRKHPSYRHLPVVMLTTQKSDRLRQEAMDKGANLFLVKPLPPPVLVEHVRQLIEG